MVIIYIGDQMKQKVIENKRTKQMKLMQSAFELFCQNDIQKVTVQQIVDKAGVAKGTFYLYFKDKYEIRDLLISSEATNLFQKAHHQLEVNDIRNFEDSVIFLVNQVLIDLENNPILLNFIQRNLSWGIFQTHLKQAINDEGINLVDDFNTRALENGYYFEKPEVTLYLIIEMVGNACYNSIINKQPIAIHELKPYLFDAVRAILSQKKVIKKDE